MSYRVGLGTVATAVLVWAVSAQEAAKVLSSPPPRFAKIENVGKEELILSELSIAPEIVDVGGKPAARIRVTPEHYRLLRISFSLKDGQVLDINGKKLGAESMQKRLVPGKIVLLSSDGKKVDPIYLEIVKEDTVVLVGQPGDSK
jgi:hypothetical protein